MSDQDDMPLGYVPGFPKCEAHLEYERKSLRRTKEDKELRKQRKAELAALRRKLEDIRYEAILKGEIPDIKTLAADYNRLLERYLRIAMGIEKEYDAIQVAAIKDLLDRIAGKPVTVVELESQRSGQTQEIRVVHVDETGKIKHVGAIGQLPSPSEVIEVEFAHAERPQAGTPQVSEPGSQMPGTACGASGDLQEPEQV